MQKWADYLVSAVRYENAVITHFKVHIDNGAEVGGGTTWTRDEVVEAMSRGKTFFTIFKDEKGNWSKGKSILLIKGDNDYIFADDRYVTKELIEGVQEL